jgi:regulator of sigma E protease
MNLIIAFLAFNVIVIVHELGHFIAAKKFGIKVLEFSLFIGPKLFSVTRGETQYSLRLFPIMAFVKMEGEEEASTSERAFNNKPKYARALTAFGGPLANLLLAAVLLTIVFSLQGYDTVKISLVEAGSPAAKAGIKVGDDILSYDGYRTYLPLDVSQFLYVSKGAPAEVEYLSGGEKIKKTIYPVKEAATANYYIGVDTGDSNTILALTPGFPAEKAGLLPGDRILKMDDTEISNKDELKAYIQKKGGQPINITVSRDGAQLHTTVVPQVQKIPERYILGIDFEVKNGNLWDNFKQSAVFTYSIVRSVGYSIVWLITGQVELNQMMGPIGMVSTIGEAVSQGPTFMAKLIYLLQITALLSIAVGATNLIPLPMLDGNRILLIGVEAVRRKPIKPEREAFISMVGFVLIILLAVYAAFNDIMRIVRG